MDGFDIASSALGTVVVLKKLLPRASPYFDSARIARVAAELARPPARDVYEEVQRQNQELLSALEDLRQRQEELLRLNGELEDTNRGVLALYAELDEKADHLRRADEVKTRFLSNMSHEFRTPLNSVLALSRLLLDRSDGPLSREQERQVELIRDAAGQLLELVNDLLDLAKVQAGRTEVRPAEFRVQELFGALRGMLRPLLVSDRFDLVIEAPDDLPPLFTDEAKVSQVLRNLISNALKFTERGEVRASARLSADGSRAIFTVSDTGIGIAREDQQRIFEEFHQLEGPLQRRVRGTGLGLPLSRRLAELLGGELRVESELGVGSTFTLEVPAVFEGLREVEVVPAAPRPANAAARVPVLVIEDSEGDRIAYESHLRTTRFLPVEVANLRDARDQLARSRPAAIVLDVVLREEESWRFLAALKADDALAGIPVIVVTGVDDERKAWALGADAYCAKPVEPERLIAELSRLTGHEPRRARRVLVVDDDPAYRHALRRELERQGCEVLEAGDGENGLRAAREQRPELVFLDVVLPAPEGGGEAVLAQLRDDAGTGSIPVVVMSAEEGEVADRVARSGTAVFCQKSRLSSQMVSDLLAGGAA